MRVAVIGAGQVGLVTGLCLAELGAEVRCVDTDRSKVEMLAKGVSPIHEPKVPELLASHLERGRIRFFGEPGPAVRGARVVFLCVNTPNRPDGGADLSQVFGAAADIAPFLEEGAVITVKSTVPVGTGKRVLEALRRLRPESDFEIASNPEFLSAGSAVDDFLQPDRVVIGADSGRAREALRELYRPLSDRGASVVVTSPETSELIKVAANAFLAAKVVFINEMADLCEETGADVRQLVHGVGLDRRIGVSHLRPGPGYGGLCFPKDTVALARTARDAGAPVRLVEAAVEANERRKLRMVARVEEACGGSVAGRVVAVLGVAFKAGTGDTRNSPGVEIAIELERLGASVRAHDPVADPEARGLAGPGDVFEAARGADALVIATAWEEYRDLDPERLREAMRAPVVLDLHNLLDAEEMLARGFDYRAIGLAIFTGSPAGGDSGSPRRRPPRAAVPSHRGAVPGSREARRANPAR